MLIESRVGSTRNKLILIAAILIKSTSKFTSLGPVLKGAADEGALLHLSGL